MRMFCNNRDCMEARMYADLKHIDEFIKMEKEHKQQLANLLEFVKGNRGPKQGNPYGITEVKEALKHLAKLEGIDDYLSVNTRKLSGWTCKKCGGNFSPCHYCAKPYCLICDQKSCPNCSSKGVTKDEK